MSDMSFSDIHQLVSGALGKQSSIRELFEDSVVYDEHDANYKLLATKRRSYSIDASRKVALGDTEQVIPRITYDPVVRMGDTEFASFADSERPTEAGGFIKDGLLFRSGEYPDKAFSLTTDEMRAACEGFTPVDLDIEHTSTVFDGKLGKLERIWTNEDGSELHGRVSLSPWVKNALGDAPIKVSTTWDRVTKKLAKLALVRNPRVSDAALMAAFSATDKDQTERVAGGKKSMGHQSTSGFWDLFMDRLFGGSSDSAGADPSPGGVALKQTEQAGFDAGLGAPGATGANGDGTGGVKPGPASDAQMVAMVAELKAMRETAFAMEVSAFVAEQTHAGRVYPTEVVLLKGDMLRAKLDDYAHPEQISFSVGDQVVQGTRYDARRAAVLARPTSKLTQDLISANGNLEALFNKVDTSKDGKEGKASGERINELLALTPLGQEVLKSAKK